MLQTWSNHQALTNIFCYAISDPNILMIWKLIIILSYTRPLTDMSLSNIWEDCGYLSQTICLLLHFSPQIVYGHKLYEIETLQNSICKAENFQWDSNCRKCAWILIHLTVSWPRVTLMRRMYGSPGLQIEPISPLLLQNIMDPCLMGAYAVIKKMLN